MTKIANCWQTRSQQRTSETISSRAVCKLWPTPALHHHHVLMAVICCCHLMPWILTLIWVPLLQSNRMASLPPPIRHRRVINLTNYFLCGFPSHWLEDNLGISNLQSSALLTSSLRAKLLSIYTAPPITVTSNSLISNVSGLKLLDQRRHHVDVNNSRYQLNKNQCQHSEKHSLYTNYQNLNSLLRLGEYFNW